MNITSIGDSHLITMSAREVGLLMAFVDTGDMNEDFPVGFSLNSGLSEFISELYGALGDIATVAHGGTWSDRTVEYVYDNESIDDDSES